jgi:hypothetical protein
MDFRETGKHFSNQGQWSVEDRIGTLSHLAPVRSAAPAPIGKQVVENTGGSAKVVHSRPDERTTAFRLLVKGAERPEPVRTFHF